MINVNETYCGNHLTTYINQTIILYTLNVYGDANYFSVELEKERIWLVSHGFWQDSDQRWWSLRVHTLTIMQNYLLIQKEDFIKTLSLTFFSPSFHLQIVTYT